MFAMESASLTRLHTAKGRSLTRLHNTWCSPDTPPHNERVLVLRHTSTHVLVAHLFGMRRVAKDPEIFKAAFNEQRESDMHLITCKEHETARKKHENSMQVARNNTQASIKQHSASNTQHSVEQAIAWNIVVVRTKYSV